MNMRNIVLSSMALILSFSSPSSSTTIKQDYVDNLQHYVGDIDGIRNMCVETVGFDFSSAFIKERPLTDKEMKYLNDHDIISYMTYAESAWEQSTHKFFKFQPAVAPNNCAVSIKINFVESKYDFDTLILKKIVKRDNWGTTIFVDATVAFIIIKPEIVRADKKILISTVAHEFGHALGLEHNDNDDGINKFDVMRKDGAYDSAFVNNKSICLNGCLRIGKASITQLHNIYGLNAQEVSLW